MDVYISFFYKVRKAKAVTFAFVRYKFRHEMVKAITEGTNRKMDGCFIRVKEALLRSEAVSHSQSHRKFNPHNHFVKTRD
ncbi:hypothetical protein REPUB_Repub01dG0028300 [Reevesia pubescens]